MDVLTVRSNNTAETNCRHNRYIKIGLKNNELCKENIDDNIDKWTIFYEDDTCGQYLIDCAFGQILVRHKSQKILPFKGIKTFDLKTVISNQTL